MSGAAKTNYQARYSFCSYSQTTACLREYNGNYFRRHERNMTRAKAMCFMLVFEAGFRNLRESSEGFGCWAKGKLS